MSKNKKWDTKRCLAVEQSVHQLNTEVFELVNDRNDLVVTMRERRMIHGTDDDIYKMLLQEYESTKKEITRKLDMLDRIEEVTNGHDMVSAN